MNAKEVQYADRVVVVEIRDQKITIHTGHICSKAGCPPAFGGKWVGTSHGDDVDNRVRTVVWGDHPFNPLADNADDAHEQCFHLGNVHLLSIAEAKALRDPESAIEWFRGIHPSEAAREIAQALTNKDSFEMPEQLRREYAAFGA